MSLCSIGRRVSSDSAELFETPFGLVDGRYPVLRFAEALFQGLFEWGEPWVEFDYSCATVSIRLPVWHEWKLTSPIRRPSGLRTHDRVHGSLVDFLHAHDCGIRG